MSENEQTTQTPNVSDAKAATEKVKGALRSALSPEAYDRIMNVSAVNKELFLGASKYLLAAYQRVGRPLTESEVVAILRSIKAQTEKQTSITFHKK